MNNMVKNPIKNPGICLLCWVIGSKSETSTQTGNPPSLLVKINGTSSNVNIMEKRMGEAEQTSGVKYRKFSIKAHSGGEFADSNTPSTNNGENLSTNTPKPSRRLKPKDSPQTLIYRPSKSKGSSPLSTLVSESSPVPETTTTTQTMSTTEKITPVIMSSTKSVSEPPTTERQKTWTTSTAKTTSGANKRFQSIGGVNGFDRPTMRSRIQFKSQESFVPERSTPRALRPNSTPRFRFSTTTNLPSSSKRWRPSSRKPDGSRSSLFPNKVRLKTDGESTTSASEQNTNLNGAVYEVKVSPIEEKGSPKIPSGDLKIYRAESTGFTEFPSGANLFTTIRSQNKPVVSIKTTEGSALDEEHGLQSDEVLSLLSQFSTGSLKDLLSTHRPATLRHFELTKGDSESFVLQAQSGSGEQRQNENFFEKTELHLPSFAETALPQTTTRIAEFDPDILLHRYEQEKMKQLERLRARNLHKIPEGSERLRPDSPPRSDAPTARRIPSLSNEAEDQSKSNVPKIDLKDNTDQKPKRINGANLRLKQSNIPTSLSNNDGAKSNEPVLPKENFDSPQYIRVPTYTETKSEYQPPKSQLESSTRLYPSKCDHSYNTDQEPSVPQPTGGFFKTSDFNGRVVTDPEKETKTTDSSKPHDISKFPPREYEPSNTNFDTRPFPGSFLKENKTVANSPTNRPDVYYEPPKFVYQPPSIYLSDLEQKRPHQELNRLYPQEFNYQDPTSTPSRFYEPPTTEYQPPSLYHPHITEKNPSRIYQPPNTEYQPPSLYHVNVEEEEPTRIYQSPTTEYHEPRIKEKESPPRLQTEIKEKEPSRIYQPPTRTTEYQPSSSTSKENVPLSRYHPDKVTEKEPSRTHQPPTTQSSFPTITENEPSSRYRPDTVTEKEPSRIYQPPTTEYQPPSHYDPPSRYQPEIGPPRFYQPPTTEYQPPSPAITEKNPPSRNQPDMVTKEEPSKIYQPPTTEYQPPSTYQPHIENNEPSKQLSSSADQSTTLNDLLFNERVTTSRTSEPPTSTEYQPPSLNRRASRPMTTRTFLSQEPFTFSPTRNRAIEENQKIKILPQGINEVTERLQFLNPIYYPEEGVGLQRDSFPITDKTATTTFRLEDPSGVPVYFLRTNINHHVEPSTIKPFDLTARTEQLLNPKSFESEREPTEEQNLQNFPIYRSTHSNSELPISTTQKSLSTVSKTLDFEVVSRTPKPQTIKGTTDQDYLLTSTRAPINNRHQIPYNPYSILENYYPIKFDSDYVQADPYQAFKRFEPITERSDQALDKPVLPYEPNIPNYYLEQSDQKTFSEFDISVPQVTEKIAEIREHSKDKTPVYIFKTAKSLNHPVSAENQTGGNNQQYDVNSLHRHRNPQAQPLHLNQPQPNRQPIPDPLNPHRNILNDEPQLLPNPFPRSEEPRLRNEDLRTSLPPFRYPPLHGKPEQHLQENVRSYDAKLKHLLHVAEIPSETSSFVREQNYQLSDRNINNPDGESIYYKRQRAQVTPKNERIFSVSEDPRNENRASVEQIVQQYVTQPDQDQEVRANVSEARPGLERIQEIPRRVFSHAEMDHEIKSAPHQETPAHDTIPPNLRFRCEWVNTPGYYADLETGCQVFHVCHANNDRNSFLCPKGTIFNQKVRVCDWLNNVNCNDSASFYFINNQPSSP